MVLNTVNISSIFLYVMSSHDTWGHRQKHNEPSNEFIWTNYCGKNCNEGKFPSIILGHIRTD